MRATSVIEGWTACKEAHNCTRACEVLLSRRSEAGNFLATLSDCMPRFPDAGAQVDFIDIEVSFDAYPMRPLCEPPRF